MSPDLLSYAEILSPVGLVIAVVYLLGPCFPLQNRYCRLLLSVFVLCVVLRYLQWRMAETLVPVSGNSLELAWMGFCFSVELLALLDAAILYLTFLRTTDRHREADAHEARLDASSDADLPSVDVLIPTYNESMEVLEKTIVGALSLDYPDFRVWVLDDGRRAWLKAYCEEKGAGYITRPDNAHAKAGNINHALQHTSGDFIAIFDADFVPQRRFLRRTLGFFADPKVGIVQVPHAFYNHDPMQTNLALRKTLPDDQRFFFEVIMPSRDGWNAAFCCGSNSVTRRSAIQEVGNALPTDSITEDMLLTLALLRKGYVTRYLCERLAFGLAPESIKAFFVQRERWARGAMQILYLARGPLGPGLSLVHRLLFMPTHWLSQSLMTITAIVAPLVFLWTGVAPLTNVTMESVLSYLLPSVLALVGGIQFYAPKAYFPLAAQVLATFQAFKLLPSILLTLIKPRGHAFKVTPKGGDAQGPGYDRGIFWASAGLMLLTVAGVLINSRPDARVVDQAALIPLVGFWSMLNVTVLFLVCMMCLQAPVRRAEERFDMAEPVWLRNACGDLLIGRTTDVSLSGTGILVDAQPEDLGAFAKGTLIRMSLDSVGFISGTIVRSRGNFIGVQFELPASLERDLLIRKIFTGGLESTTTTASGWGATLGLLERIWLARTSVASAAAPPAAGPPALERLPKRTLVVPPAKHRVDLKVVAEARAGAPSEIHASRRTEPVADAASDHEREAAIVSGSRR